jgi:hypothetical protein
VLAIFFVQIGGGAFSSVFFSLPLDGFAANMVALLTLFKYNKILKVYPLEVPYG